MKLFRKKQKDIKKGKFSAIGALMVSKMVVDENIKPRFMYREKRSRAEDSGWRIFTGLETDEYSNNPKNIGIYSPETILAIDPSIEPILQKGVGSVYEKTEDNFEWQKVTDFEMEDDFLVKHNIIDEWTITINNLFEKTKEKSGDLLYTTGDKSVRMSMFNFNDDIISKENIYERYRQIVDREQVLAKALQSFELSDSEVLRIGYWTKDKDEVKEYNVINGFCIIDNQVIHVAFYFDNDEDLSWATETWKQIKLN